LIFLHLQSKKRRAYRSELRTPEHISPQLAYFLAMLIGDGSVGTLDRPTIYMVGHSVDERSFYDSIIIPLIGKLFGVQPYSYTRKRKQAYALHFKSRRLVEYLVDEIGFPNKKEPKRVPIAISSAPESIVLAFIRGLFDSDGSLIFSKKTYSNYQYPSIEIKSVNRRLAYSTTRMLSVLGFRASLGRSVESWVVRINGCEMLELWMTRIGSWNVKHLTKYLLWKKQGFCIPKTTVPIRLTMLGLQSDRLFYKNLLSEGTASESISRLVGYSWAKDLAYLGPDSSRDNIHFGFL